MVTLRFIATLRGKSYHGEKKYSIVLTIPREVILAYGLNPMKLIGKRAKVIVEIPDEKDEKNQN